MCSVKHYFIGQVFYCQDAFEQVLAQSSNVCFLPTINFSKIAPITSGLRIHTIIAMAKDLIDIHIPGRS